MLYKVISGIQHVLEMIVLALIQMMKAEEEKPGKIDYSIGCHEADRESLPAAMHWVWKHFLIETLTNLRVCQRCGEKIENEGTSIMAKHLRTVHSDIVADVDESIFPVLRRKKPFSLRDKSGLMSYARNVTSQCGEDGIIEYIFSDKGPLAAVPDVESRRIIVEVGSWDGKHLSNSYSLLAAGSWHGVLIEADKLRSQAGMDLHAAAVASGKVTCIAAEVGVSGANALDMLLASHAPWLPRKFDVLSIDVDGIDYHIWDSLTNYRPSLVIIEFNPTIPNHVVFVQSRDVNVRQGSSLAAMIELATAKGYNLVETTLFNAFFVPSELYPRFATCIPRHPSIDTLHECTMGTDLFQLYDGTVQISGCKKLLWHRVRMDVSKMQPLRSEERIFPFAPGLAGSEG